MAKRKLRDLRDEVEQLDPRYEDETLRSLVERNLELVSHQAKKTLEKPERLSVNIDHRHILLNVRPGTGKVRRQEIVEEWYRNQLKAKIPSLIEKWELQLQVPVAGFTVRKMKTRWGSCNPVRRSILLNLELAKKPSECLEYIVVHEMVHLLEPTHSDRFVALMDQFLPQWRQRRDQLNQTRGDSDAPVLNYSEEKLVQVMSQTVAGPGG